MTCSTLELYDLRTSYRQDTERSLVTCIQTEDFWLSDATRYLKKQGFYFSRPIWEKRYEKIMKTGEISMMEERMVEEQLCCIQYEGKERLYFSHREYPDGKRMVVYSILSEDSDFRTKYYIEPLRLLAKLQYDPCLSRQEKDRIRLLIGHERVNPPVL